MNKNITVIYTKAETAPILSALQLALGPGKGGGAPARNRRGRFGFERSLPENPALINTFLRMGIKRTVEMNAAREKPHEA